MVIKSTGIVLAAILVIGAGIWIIDFAVSGAVTGLDKLVDKVNVTETTEKDEDKDDKDDHEGHDHADEDTTEKTTEKE